MIRLALFSQDLKLRPLLAPALGTGFQVTVEPDPGRLKELLSNGSIDVVLLDLDTNYSKVEAVLQFYDEISSFGAAVVALTDDGGRPAAVELVQRGVHSYCRKPPVIRELKPMLRRAYEHSVMKRQLEGTLEAQSKRDEANGTAGCDGLIGRSASMQAIYELIGRVADLNASVLITGESGTGKELIARAIHNLGNRSKAPFVAVSCGAIPETLIESELFGHEKGAFTGTAGVRTGFFEQAGCGTLFLDEIGELSLQTQVKLLRVLQQREFTRLGGSRAIPLRARIILATHRDLRQMIEAGTFRLDLFYRIQVVTINAPALADRPEDIPALAQHFLKMYGEAYMKPMKEISAAAMKMLGQYDWPGNIRELENAIQSAIIRADGDTIEPEDLPERLREQEDLELQDDIESDLPQIGSFERMLRDYKIKLATKAIKDCKGNKTLAARSLEISRAYLHRLIRLAEVENIDAA
ncbi:MAG TPA: sigma-54 dependent transcriptional regulator [Bryobacteraceae bacterium]|jgi:DNA-binding NtrC family response regulator